MSRGEGWADGRGFEMSSWLQLGGAVVGVGAVGALQMPVRSTLYALCAGPGSTHMNAMLQADDAGVQCSGWLLLRRALHSPQAEEWLCSAAALRWGWGWVQRCLAWASASVRAAAALACSRLARKSGLVARQPSQPSNLDEHNAGRPLRVSIKISSERLLQSTALVLL